MHQSTSQRQRDKRTILIALLLLLLSACSATPYHQQKKGVLVADFYADKVGTVLVLVEKSAEARPVAVIEITPMDNFRVLELSAGEYTWSELREPGRVTPLSGHFDINVQADTINYIGSILIKSYQTGPQISVVNQTTEVRQRLQTDYPAIAQRFPFMLNLTHQHQ